MFINHLTHVFYIQVFRHHVSHCEYFFMCINIVNILGHILFCQQSFLLKSVLCMLYRDMIFI